MYLEVHTTTLVKVAMLTYVTCVHVYVSWLMPPLFFWHRWLQWIRWIF